MTPQQLIAYMQNLTLKTIDLVNLGSNLAALVTRANKTIDRSDSMSSPLSQAETNQIIAVQGPAYTAAKAAILAAYQALP